MNQVLAGLVWQPAGTLEAGTTTPSERIRTQTYTDKRRIHARTTIKEQHCFLLLRVGDEEAVVGPVGKALALGELARKAPTAPLRMSASEMLRLVEDTEDKDNRDRSDKLLASHYEGGDEDDERCRFYRQVHEYTKQHIQHIYKSELTEASKNNDGDEILAGP